MMNKIGHNGGPLPPILIVRERLTPDHVRINGQPCIKCKARKKTICHAAKMVINPGDEVYRPFGNHMIRYLASEVEAAEAATTKS